MVRIIEHKDLTIGDFATICKLKQKSWPRYSYEDHAEWILKNHPDLHCLYENVAYCNIVKIEIEIDGVKTDALGFGNLCSDNRGYGGFLMKKLLLQYDSPKLSFCSYEFESYYRSLGWQFIHRSKVMMPKIELELSGIRVMTHDIPGFNLLTYNGTKF